MKPFEVEWDESKNTINKARHRISFEEAATVFEDVLSVTIPDPDHSLNERRLLTIGESNHARLLVISHTERKGRVRIISARKPTGKERKQYEES